MQKAQEERSAGTNGSPSGQAQGCEVREQVDTLYLQIC